MARDQTILSELCVALGILGKKPDAFNELYVIENVLEQDICKYTDEYYKRLLSGRGETIENLFKSGVLINNWLNNKIKLPNIEITWTGKNKIGATEQAAKDLAIKHINWRISVKENSNIILNGSPQRIFEKLPFGDFNKSKSSDWFIYTAYEELNNYFKICLENYRLNYLDICHFYNNTYRDSERKEFSKYVAQLHLNKNITVINAYKVLCNKVSKESANIFNSFIEQSRAKMDFKNRLKNIFHYFFRINGVRYILAGTYQNQPISHIIKPSDEWQKEYDFIDMVATPNNCGQPEVNLLFKFKNKLSKQNIELNMRAEIRWSHGKFCGNPESKLYQTWNPNDLPWIEIIQ